MPAVPGLVPQLADAGVGHAIPLALVLTPAGVCLAWAGGGRTLATADPAAVVREVEALGPRWVWWDARTTASGPVAAGLRLRACWDLAAVGRLLHGLHRPDPAAVWATAHGLTPPEVSEGELDLLDLGGEDGQPVRADGHLSREWTKGAWAGGLERGLRWAELALQVQQRQAELAGTLPEPRPGAHGVPLAVLTAYAESAAALLAVELELTGLPVDESAAAELLHETVGPRPADEQAARTQREARDAVVLAHFPERRVDLRNPAQVRELLLRVGIDVPDTRSWRLQPHAAQAGLHNLPTELRPMVRAEPGHLLVRADLGQVEPRVLAVVSGDVNLARAAAEDDMYAPVAARLRCDRPTAKVAVLAAMYGQTSGAAGEALAEMERAYPRAIAYLRDAELAGREGRTVRTYGGRLLNSDAEGSSMSLSARGRYVRNAMVQGAAAELFKAWAATARAGLDAVGGEIVLCLHDELLLHVPEAAADDAVVLTRTALASAASWWAAGSGVRFVADVSVGRSWAEAH